MEERIIKLLTGFASLFLKFIRSVNDQRILGFLALSVGVLSLWQPVTTINVVFPTALAITKDLSLNARIFTDLLIISGVGLLLLKDTNFRWFTVLSIPLQLHIITSYMNSRNASISNLSTTMQYVQLDNIIIAILIYRQIAKLALLEIINNTNNSDDLRGEEEENAEHNRSIIASSNTWLPSSNISNPQGIVSSDNSLDQE